jgi:hypothetical protein
MRPPAGAPEEGVPSPPRGLSWNPAVEDQCTDRVYRIGQERPVHVHQVLAIHPEYSERSFDVRLASLLERKRELNRSVLAPTAATSADFEELYRMTVGA